MKKAIAIVLLLAMVLSTVACAAPAAEPAEVAAPVETKAVVEETAAPEEPAVLEYPVRPIQNVIPFGAGGGTDVWNRALMAAMGEIMGQTIVSANMTGGSAGSIGIDYAWKSNHDGYTLAGTSETPLTIPVQTGLPQTSKDWSYFIAAGSPGVLCVNKNSQYKSMDEILAALTANPESVSIAGTTGGLWFALAKLFESYGDVPFKWLPYDGSGPAIKGAVSNEADCVVASAGEVKDFVRAGDLIPLVVMSTEDWEFPEFGNVEAVTKKVPALGAYLPLIQFLGFKVPADTDPAIIAYLQDAFKQAMDSDAIKTFAGEQLCVMYNLTGAEASQMAAAVESKLCWVLYDMGQTKFSPEEFGIPKP
ncbi:MAG: tripartite tricarboxylate transporter substrate binding protein [Eubacteriales bacterium]|nr:tripartite tricarboxylate transporter substrate binding protein [Eubacteriales bacterium]